MIRQDTDDNQSLFLQDTPIMDVCAPIEFNKGAFPCSQKIPLLNNQQREVVRIRYKQEGQDAAVARKSMGIRLD